MYLFKVGTWSSVLINQVSSFQGCPVLKASHLSLLAGFRIDILTVTSAGREEERSYLHATIVKSTFSIT